jgi:hypothetical protein
MEKNKNEKVAFTSWISWVYVLIFFFVGVAAINKYALRFQHNLEHNLIFPGGYGKYEMKSMLIHDITYYYPAFGDRMGYIAPLPATPYPSQKLILRGESMEQGFQLTD